MKSIEVENYFLNSNFLKKLILTNLVSKRLRLKVLFYISYVNNFAVLVEILRKSFFH
jgi:hypothetical protein